MVGTVGQSYLGLVQYFAATQRPPHLRAMSPVSGAATYFENFAYRHGAFELGWVLSYFAFMARDTLMRKGIYDRERPGLDRFVSYPDIPMAPLKRDAYMHLQLSDWGERLKAGAPYLANYLRHSTYDSFWAEHDLRTKFDEVDVPMLPHRLMVRRIPIRHAHDVQGSARTCAEREGAARTAAPDGSVGTFAALLDSDLQGHRRCRFWPGSRDRTPRDSTAMV
jgi:hypothetical protein